MISSTGKNLKCNTEFMMYSLVRVFKLKLEFLLFETA